MLTAAYDVAAERVAGDGPNGEVAGSETSPNGEPAHPAEEPESLPES